MKRSATASFLLHLAVLVGLLFYMPKPTLPEAGDPDAVQMEFTGPPHKGPATHKNAAATAAEKREETRAAAPPRLGTTAHHSAPKPTPVTPTPPVPTPPPTPPQRQIPTPPMKLPPPPPPPPPTAQPAVPLPPPPPPVRHPPKVKPTPPMPPVAKPSKPTPTKQVAHEPSKPQHQVSKTADSADDDSAMDSALSSLRSGSAKGRKESKADSSGAMEGALASLRAGGSPEAGGSPNATNDNGGLSRGDKEAIADGVRRCWTADFGEKDIDKFSVALQVTTDATGEARMVKISPSETGHMNSDPSFRAFAERAVRTVNDSRCSKLALPSNYLGKNHRIDFRFSPNP